MKKDMNRRYLMLHDTAAYLKEKGVPGTGLDSAGVCFSLRVPLDDLLIPCMLVYEPRESGADIARIDCDLSSVAGKAGRGGPGWFPDQTYREESSVPYEIKCGYCLSSDRGSRSYRDKDKSPRTLCLRGSVTCKDDYLAAARYLILQLQRILMKDCSVILNEILQV